MPAIARHHQREHGVELLFQAVGAFAVGFVQHENVADFHQAGFHVLDVVAKAGDQNDEHAIGQAHDVDFILADADGFDQHLTLARRIEQQRHFGGGARQAAQKTARGHRADEDAGVAGVALHADAVAQNRAAGVGLVGSTAMMPTASPACGDSARPGDRRACFCPCPARR